MIKIFSGYKTRKFVVEILRFEYFSLSSLLDNDIHKL
jgi:hypothetical protein